MSEKRRFEKKLPMLLTLDSMEPRKRSAKLMRFETALCR
jgi:hypothetical protein